MKVQKMYRSQDVPRSAVEDFFLDSGIDASGEDFPYYLKEAVVGGRMDWLIRNEWQRWAPGIGLRRLLGDVHNGNRLLLDKMHSVRYNDFNDVYTAITSTGIIYLLVELGVKYLA